MNQPLFLCDEMLQRLGRWLRAAGYDTAIAESGADDRDLMAQAVAEGRLLLTRDRHMARLRAGQGHVVLLEQNTLPGVVAEVSVRCTIDWSVKPFSRCLVCNTPVVSATAAQRTRLPEGALRISEQVWYCPHCDKLYWEGSHVRRMRHTLENFARGLWLVADD